MAIPYGKKKMVVSTDYSFYIIAGTSDIFWRKFCCCSFCLLYILVGEKILFKIPEKHHSDNWFNDRLFTFS